MEFEEVLLKRSLEYYGDLLLQVQELVRMSPPIFMEGCRRIDLLEKVHTPEPHMRNA